MAKLARRLGMWCWRDSSWMVALAQGFVEVAKSVLQEFVDAPVPCVDELLEVVTSGLQERVHQIVTMFVDVPVRQSCEQTLEVVKLIPQGSIDERVVDVPVSHVCAETAEMVKLVPQGIVEVTVPPFLNETVELMDVPKVSSQHHFLQREVWTVAGNQVAGLRVGVVTLAGES